MWSNQGWLKTESFKSKKKIVSLQITLLYFMFIVLNNLKSDTSIPMVKLYKVLVFYIISTNW